MLMGIGNTVFVGMLMCVRMGVLVGVFTLGDVVVFVVHDASLLCDLNLLNVEPVICRIAVHTQFLSVLQANPVCAYPLAAAIADVGIKDPRPLRKLEPGFFDIK